jgi:hypothetical protein
MGVKAIRKINSVIKSTLLSVSLFHHMAGFRSFFYGVGGAHLRGIKGYRNGLKKLEERTGFKNENYQHLGPIADLLIREGLTVGRTQDWDETQMQDSVIEEFLGKRSGKFSRATQVAFRGLRRRKQGFTTGLFGRLFAGLKVEAAAYELEHGIKQKEKDLGRKLNDREIKLVAQQKAALINADFGGLHLQRMGRNPNFQRLAQMFLLAPDWTESNWRTVTGMVNLRVPFTKMKDRPLNNVINKVLGDNPEVQGMHKEYRKFWGGIAMKAAISVALLQAAVLASGTDDDREEYWDFWKSQFGSIETFSKGRWAGLDVTHLFRKAGIGDPDKRQVVSVLGHFKDVLKVFDLWGLVKHKASPIVKAGESFATMTDWKKEEFEGVSGMLKDGQVRLLKEKRSPFDRPEKGGTLGKLDQLPSWIYYNIRGAAPIAANELSQIVTGETSGVAGISRALGLDLRDVSHKPVAQTQFEDKVKEINELERDLKEAKLLKDSQAIRDAKEAIKDYPGFNRTKSRIGFTKTQLNFWNNKAKPLRLKEKKGIKLTDREAKSLRLYKEKMKGIYRKAMKVINK